MRLLKRISSPLALLLATIPERTFATVYGNACAGEGALTCGLNAARGQIMGLITNVDLPTLVVNIIVFVLDFLALAAVIFIIVAGIRLIVSQGEEEQKEKAKKTILYVIIGLVIVLLSRFIVSFFTGSNSIVTDIVS